MVAILRNDQQQRLLMREVDHRAKNALAVVQAVVRLTAARFHEIMVTDPNDVFYDHGEARLVALIERVHEDLSGLISRFRSDAS